MHLFQQSLDILLLHLGKAAGHQVQVSPCGERDSLTDGSRGMSGERSGRTSVST